MYEAAKTMIGHSLVASACQEGLYTQEKHLFYLAMENFIYQYRKSIGMLSAYAEPFYPPTEEKQNKKDIIKEASAQNKDAEKTTNIQNEKINQVAIPESTKEKISIQEINNVIEEDWVQVKRNAKTRVVQEALQQAYIKNVKNRYAELKVYEEEVEEKDDKQILSVVKKEDETQHRTNNVNDITVDEMEKHINEYKKKDVITKDHEETRNVIKNSRGYYKTSSNLSVKTQDETKKNIIIDSDSEIDDDTDYDDSITDDENDLNNDDIDSDDTFTNGSTDEEISDGEELENEKNHGEENLHENEERDYRIEHLLYQNDLLLFRLEQIEMNEEKLRAEIYLQTKAKKIENNQEVIKVQK